MEIAHLSAEIVGLYIPHVEKCTSRRTESVFINTTFFPDIVDVYTFAFLTRCARTI